METKICTMCKEDLPRSDFSCSPKGGIAGRCRPCTNNHRRTPKFRAIRVAWAAKNLDKVKAYRVKYNDSHRDQIQAANKANYIKHPERAVERKHRYRSRLRNAYVESVSFAYIVERDGLGCYLCKQDKPDKLTFEHVVPLSRGGLHCKSNVKLAHYSCNCKKRHRLPEELDWYVH